MDSGYLGAALVIASAIVSLLVMADGERPLE
jgi:hypothetical protein